MQPVGKQKGSPTTIPRTTSGMYGTADEQSASGNIKSTDAADKTFHAGPIPIYLVPQTISKEIHAHGGNIAGITVRRTHHHTYMISLTRTGPQGKKADEAGEAPCAHSLLTANMFSYSQ